MSDEDEVLIVEAWYNCPKHGMQHHPLGPNTDDPCPKCTSEWVASQRQGKAEDET